MNRGKEKEAGFTLIELLIVVAILGILAAVVVPNVGRFLGRGEEEARRTEWNEVRALMAGMLTANGLSSLARVTNGPSGGCGVGTNNMAVWPDSTTVAGSADKKKDPTGLTYAATDKAGYLLYSHDQAADGGTTTLVNYATKSTTRYCYTAATDGSVTQYLVNGTPGAE
ncbi:MAG: type II secretion system protein [Chloroflexi bacterium]|nr:type II secretion system protein [Chloroflexota bacterium]